VTQDPAYWTDASKLLARANCVVTSIEDINGDWQVAHKWAAQTRLLVVTQGAEGCTAFINGEGVRVPAPQVEEVEPTGAGDIFAATLFLSLQRGNDPVSACAFACCIAAQSVTRRNMAGLPTAEDIRRCEALG
jgi:sugar/nucleoside kinase (ribokinase family)